MMGKLGKFKRDLIKNGLELDFSGHRSEKKKHLFIANTYRMARNCRFKNRFRFVTDNIVRDLVDKGRIALGDRHNKTKLDR